MVTLSSAAGLQKSGSAEKSVDDHPQMEQIG